MPAKYTHDHPKSSSPKTELRDGVYYRQCNKCHQWMELEKNFSLKSRNPDSRYYMHRNYTCQTCKTIHRRCREMGITFEEYTALGKNCHICGTDKTRNGALLLSLDHDHKTGKARGILCNRCNSALGMFDDDPNLLGLAIKYLEKHR